MSPARFGRSRHASGEEGQAGSSAPLTFAVVCLGRVGSEHLVTMLDSHPDARCFGELFNPQTSAYAAERRGHHLAYLREVSADLAVDAIGCKIPWLSLCSYPDLMILFHDPALRIVRLVRRNLLSIHLSVLHAVATGTTHSTERGHDPSMRVRVVEDVCLEQLFGFFLAERFMDELTRHSPVFRIEYEDLNDPARLEDLQRFLGVEPQALRSPHKKLVSRPLAEAIENYDEVVEMLTGTPWESFLEGEGITADHTADEVQVI